MILIDIDLRVFCITYWEPKGNRLLKFISSRHCHFKACILYNMGMWPPLQLWMESCLALSITNSCFINSFNLFMMNSYLIQTKNKFKFPLIKSKTGPKHSAWQRWLYHCHQLKISTFQGSVLQTELRALRLNLATYIFYTIP